jgi:hypothetical protein
MEYGVNAELAADGMVVIVMSPENSGIAYES